MHRCFELPELVLRIVEAVHPGYMDFPFEWESETQGYEGVAAVVALTRTSRIFLEPALDVLWYTQLDILPLLKLLDTPSYTWSRGTRHDSKDPALVHVGVAELMEWVRLCIHSLIS